ncbi:hypothetical protein BESB_037220 [Besnoitia besnoiti]|uniref:Uncharacterized protein n=1 Tax=Besnoitia besnoiti TaxID=94643 RepID=A0A2A9MJ99_BESBE|nr:hypothetical protein BESB_037220 [Besnoitia besnoiti]PFH37264.1 hypothetical protein BESB_037220 [Besnoitia besnoiti]
MSLSSSSYLVQQELINSRTEAIFAALHLRSFVLRLPIVNVADAEKTRQGIFEKILKNRSYSCTRSNPKDAFTRQPNPELAAAQTEEIVEMLSAPSSVGFVLVVVEEAVQTKGGSGQAEYCPVGGGIVEVVDEHERSIRGLWCRRSLPPDFSSLLMKALCLRIFAQAFEWPDEPAGAVGVSPGGAGTPGTGVSSGGGTSRGGSSSKNPYRLVSCTEKALLLFPRDAVTFLTETLMLSKHWETELDGGSHNDHPTVKCKCQKLSKLPGAWQFYGICESRFLNYWRPGLQFRNFLPDAPPPALCDFLLLCRQQGTSRPSKYASPHIGRRVAAGLPGEEGDFNKENLDGSDDGRKGGGAGAGERKNGTSPCEGSSSSFPDFNGAGGEGGLGADAKAFQPSGPGTRQSSRRQQQQLIQRYHATSSSYAYASTYATSYASSSLADGAAPPARKRTNGESRNTGRGTAAHAPERGAAHAEGAGGDGAAKKKRAESPAASQPGVPAEAAVCAEPAGRGSRGDEREGEAQADAAASGPAPRPETEETSSAEADATATGADEPGGGAERDEGRESGQEERRSGESTQGVGDLEEADASAAKRLRVEA